MYPSQGSVPLLWGKVSWSLLETIPCWFLPCWCFSQRKLICPCSLQYANDWQLDCDCTSTEMSAFPLLEKNPVYSLLILIWFKLILVPYFLSIYTVLWAFAARTPRKNINDRCDIGFPKIPNMIPIRYKLCHKVNWSTLNWSGLLKLDTWYQWDPCSLTLGCP